MQTRDQTQPQVKRVNTLVILQLNVRNFNNKKIPHVKLLIEDHSPDILFFNEFGKTEDAKVFPSLPGYTPITYQLKGNFSGVCTYVKMSIVHLVTLIKVEHDMEMAQIAAINVAGFVLYNVYRSPSMDKPKNKHEIEKFTNFIATIRDYNSVVIGDLNLHVLWDTYESDNALHREIAAAFLDKGMVQYQYSPTFASGRTLDVTLSNNLSIVTSCTVDDKFEAPDTGIDHRPTITHLSLDVLKQTKKQVPLRLSPACSFWHNCQ